LVIKAKEPGTFVPSSFGTFVPKLNVLTVSSTIAITKPTHRPRLRVNPATDYNIGIRLAGVGGGHPSICKCLIIKGMLRSQGLQYIGKSSQTGIGWILKFEIILNTA